MKANSKRTAKQRPQRRDRVQELLTALSNTNTHRQLVLYLARRSSCLRQQVANVAEETISDSAIREHAKHLTDCMKCRVLLRMAVNPWTTRKYQLAPGISFSDGLMLMSPEVLSALKLPRTFPRVLTEINGSYTPWFDWMKNRGLDPYFV